MNNEENERSGNEYLMKGGHCLKKLITLVKARAKK
jgi:hypothetical protein